MAGKAIYFTEKELDMLRRAFDESNFSFEDNDNAEELYQTADSIREKLWK